MISPTRIAEITALAEAATPGPWSAETPMGDEAPWIVQGGQEAHEWEPIATLGDCLEDLNPKSAEQRQITANAAFIAAARTAVPELLAENTRLYDLAKANNALARHNSDAFVAERAKNTALIEEREAMVARMAELKGALTICEDAINEQFRYWEGGETRGSYDGKPERHALRRAQNTARAALKEQS